MVSSHDVNSKLSEHKTSYLSHKYMEHNAYVIRSAFIKNCHLHGSCIMLKLKKNLVAPIPRLFIQKGL